MEFFFIPLGIIILVLSVVLLIAVICETEPIMLLPTVILFAIGCLFFNIGTDILLFKTEPRNEIIPKNKVRIYEKDDGFYLSYKDNLTSITGYTDVISVKENDFQLYRQVFETGVVALPSCNKKHIIQYKYFNSKGRCLGQIYNLSE